MDTHRVFNPNCSSGLSCDKPVQVKVVIYVHTPEPALVEARRKPSPKYTPVTLYLVMYAYRCTYTVRLRVGRQEGSDPGPHLWNPHL